VKNLVIGTAVLSIGLTGCSIWPEAEVPMEPERVAELQIPTGLKAQRRPNQYDIPAVNAQGQRPEELDLRAPMQVLAVATNSHVEEDEKDVRVWFERNEYSGDLLPYLQKNIAAFFAAENIEVKQIDATHWQTGWVPQYSETGWWLWKGQELVQEGRFEITLEPKTHGRTVGLTSRLLEQRYTEEGQKLTAISQRREEVNFLNRVIDSIATVELAAIKEARAKLPEYTLTRAKTEQNEPVLLTKQDIDTTWSQLELLLEAVSLEVTDMNQTDYLYYVKYTKENSGFWNSLWSSGADLTLPLNEDGEYQLKLQKATDGTVIHVYDSEGKPLDPAVVDDIYRVFGDAIRENKLEL
jgi:uncharacterized lipoprotein